MAKWDRWKNIMKCYPFEEKRLNKWEPPYIVQPKYDGFRCRAVPLPNGNCVLLSSEENVIYSVPHINEMFNKLGLTQELDGELYNHNLDFNTLSSIVSRTVNLHPDHKRIQFHLFDVVDELRPQMSRVLDTQEFIGKSKHLIVSPYWVCNNLEEIMQVYNELVILGYEGIIVRHYMAGYVRRRSTYVMKFKPKQEDTYVILGYQEETSINGTPKGQLGSLLCSSGDGNTFAVGTGFTEQQRRNMWEVKDKLVGRTARVQYQHITPGNKVPRFPVFVEVI